MANKCLKRRAISQAPRVDAPTENGSLIAAPPDVLAVGTSIAQVEWDAVFRSGSVRAYVYLHGENDQQYITIEPRDRVTWIELLDLQEVVKRANDYFDHNVLFGLRSDLSPPAN